MQERIDVSSFDEMRVDDGKAMSTSSGGGSNSLLADLPFKRRRRLDVRTIY